MKKLLCTLALVATLVAPRVARAQVTVGPVGALHSDPSTLGIGAYAGIPIPTLEQNLSIDPSFILYFPDTGTYWELNGDAVYHFRVAEDVPVLPFALAGLNIVHASANVLGTTVSNTDAGLNLGGGVGFRARSVRPFVGGKFEFHDTTRFVLFGGVGFSVGG